MSDNKYKFPVPVSFIKFTGFKKMPTKNMGIHVKIAITIVVMDFPVTVFLRLQVLKGINTKNMGITISVVVMVYAS